MVWRLENRGFNVRVVRLFGAPCFRNLMTVFGLGVSLLWLSSTSLHPSPYLAPSFPPSPPHFHPLSSSLHTSPPTLPSLFSPFHSPLSILPFPLSPLHSPLSPLLFSSPFSPPFSPQCSESQIPNNQAPPLPPHSVTHPRPIERGLSHPIAHPAPAQRGAERSDAQAQAPTPSSLCGVQFVGCCR